ncbi:hypothetical protein PBRA_006535 [Plasmodiophora brassicae]|uniref:PWI domain-containing protein n=1 Tax=Plasmodiophora brassicae TaxID=37360 RepID=A0A0G4ITI0_PLABS|nr:hypothetical protein PBRA_006535 [Plasmodiophora brassicae]
MQNGDWQGNLASSVKQEPSICFARAQGSRTLGTARRTPLRSFGRRRARSSTTVLVRVQQRVMQSSFFRGTSLEQDARFSNKNKAMIAKLKCPASFSRKVDMARVSLETLKPWISQRITDLLGIEDDVVVNLCFNMLESGGTSLDPREIQINLTGFLGTNAAVFVTELWNLLLEAQDAPGGIPVTLLQSFMQAQQEQAANQVQEPPAPERHDTKDRSLRRRQPSPPRRRRSHSPRRRRSSPRSRHHPSPGRRGTRHRSHRSRSRSRGRRHRSRSRERRHRRRSTDDEEERKRRRRHRHRRSRSADRKRGQEATKQSPSEEARLAEDELRLQALRSLVKNKSGHGHEGSGPSSSSSLSSSSSGSSAGTY